MPDTINIRKYLLSRALTLIDTAVVDVIGLHFTIDSFVLDVIGLQFAHLAASFKLCICMTSTITRRSYVVNFHLEGVWES